MSRYRLERLGAGATLPEFIEVAWRVNAGDPSWVPPLKLLQQQDLVDSAPFFEHAEWAAWVAYDGATPVGRVSAQIDQLYQAQHADRSGYLGFLDGPDDPDCWRQLIDAAADWLAARDMRSMVGPFRLGINQELGVLVEGFDTPPFFMMGHNPAYYDERYRQAGLMPEQDLLAYLLPTRIEAPPKAMVRLKDRALAQARLRPLDKSRVRTELEAMRQVFNDAWSSNWGFVPFQEEEFQRIGKEMLLIIPPEFIQLAEIDGELVAFIVLLPNVNEVISDLNGRLLPLGWARLLYRLKVRYPHTGRVPLMGVRQRYHHTRLGPGLAFAVIDALQGPAQGKGLHTVELSWILESNSGMRNIIESIGGRISKRYRMYRKPLG